jgi:serine/threonine protein kinase
VDTPRRTFTVERCLGRGGFGEVYLAEMSGRGGLSTSVALKVLRRDLAPDGAAIRRLRDEGRHLARLDHPTILKVHDLVVLDGRVALVTEYVAGEDLEGCLRAPSAISPRALVEVVGRVASALEAAWIAPLGAGGGPLRLAHRDIKPSNIRIGRFGEVKLLDFGIARSDEVTREARTQTDMMIGSPPYMAPERFLDNDVRLASDLYSLGATLLEGLLGRRAFDLPVTMLAAHAVDRGRYEGYVAARFAELVGADPALVALTRSLLAHDPAARPEAGEVVRSCEDLVDQLPGATLAEWCRAHPFTTSSVRGELDGRLVTAEGTFDLPVPAPEEPTPTPRTRSRGWLGVVLGSVSVLSLTAVSFAVVALGVGAWGVWWVSRAPEVVAQRPEPLPPREDPALDPAPGPGPVVPPPPAPTPVDPAPARPRPVAGPAPTPAQPQPLPVAPVPAAPAPAPTGRVAFTGDVDHLVMVRGSTRVNAPAAVESGTWSYEVTFAGGRVSVGTFEVPAGGVVTLDCSPRMGTCQAR